MQIWEAFKVIWSEVEPVIDECQACRVGQSSPETGASLCEDHTLLLRAFNVARNAALNL